MLTDGKHILDVAHAESFAVPAFNLSDWAMAVGVFEICNELDAPFIAAIHPDELAHTREEFVLGIRELAHKARVPVAIHYDHGTTHEHMLQAIHTRFTSAMMDGSIQTFEENVRRTKAAVELLHPVGITVEGELGTIGKTDDEAEAGTDNIIYTDPAEAVQFIEQTGVDFLAVAIGTSHGVYPSWMKPELKLDLLKEIKAAVDVPLVLHGGSGNPDDEIAQAAKLGINKINISSDIKVAYHQEMRRVLEDEGKREPNAIQPLCIEACQKEAAHKIQLFGADGKGQLYK